MNKLIALGLCLCLAVSGMALPVLAEEAPQAATEYAPAFPRHSQTDYPDLSLDGGSLAQKGSALSCLSMVISGITGQNMTPDLLLPTFQALGRTDGERMERTADVLGIAWSKAENVRQVFSAVDEGRLVIVMMNESSIFPLPRHFLVLYGRAEDGRLLVRDPYGPDYDHWQLSKALEEGFQEKDLLLGYSAGWIFTPEGVEEALAAAREEEAARQELARQEELAQFPQTGVPLYFQNDYPNDRYGIGTVASNGCSMVSLAMVANAMTGYTYGPDVLADYFGGYGENNVQRLEHGSDMLQLPWRRAENIHDVMDALEQGNLAIVLMGEDSLFTQSQHFIVLAGLTEDGRILVNDSNKNNYSHWQLSKAFYEGFEEDDITRGYSGAWIYDVSAVPENPFYYEEQKVYVEPRYPGIDLTWEEQQLLARVIWVEARGESAEGQQAVAEIVYNRMVSGDFPNTLRQVIYAENQFRSVPFLKDAEPGQAQYEALENALSGPYVLPKEVVHFASYPVNDRVWGTIGGHIFCYG